MGQIGSHKAQSLYWGMGGGSSVELLHSHSVQWVNHLLPPRGAAVQVPGMQPNFWNWDSLVRYNHLISILKGLSSEICLAGNGTNQQISLKRTGAEIISCFSPSTLK
jgi:hypothetical protein